MTKLKRTSASEERRHVSAIGTSVVKLLLVLREKYDNDRPESGVSGVSSSRRDSRHALREFAHHPLQRLGERHVAFERLARGAQRRELLVEGAAFLCFSLFFFSVFSVPTFFSRLRLRLSAKKKTPGGFRSFDAQRGHRNTATLPGIFSMHEHCPHWILNSSSAGAPDAGSILWALSRPTPAPRARARAGACARSRGRGTPRRRRRAET